MSLNDREHVLIQAEENIITIFHESLNKKVWAIAGGKGGTGKTAIAANIGLALATLGYRVILVDADLGGANLHTILGIRNPHVNLSDFIARRKESLYDIIIDTPNDNLKLISGGNEMIGLANLSYQTKIRLKRHLIQLQADYIILDLGAGSSYNVIDLFTLTDEGIIITNPEPTAKLNAYTFLKNCVYRVVMRNLSRDSAIKKILLNAGRKGSSSTYTIPDILKMVALIDSSAAEQMQKTLDQFSPKLIMNKVRKQHHSQEAIIITKLAKQFLGITVEYLGIINDDLRVMEATENMLPFVLLFPECKASRDVYHLISRMGVEDQFGRLDTQHLSKFTQMGKMKRIMRRESSHWT